jgi:hypothetical protein
MCRCSPIQRILSREQDELLLFRAVFLLLDTGHISEVPFSWEKTALRYSPSRTPTGKQL